MKVQSENKLIELNNQFYEAVARSFDDSRSFFWEGWEQLLPYLKNKKKMHVLDLACGNGRFAEWLDHNHLSVNKYQGVDASQKLLIRAQKKKYSFEAAFQKTNLFSFTTQQKYDLIVIFGFMHHIPGDRLRKKILDLVYDQLKDDGLAVLTFWQFMRIPNHRERTQALADTRLISDAEPNDYVLDWQRDQFNDHEVQRYCHLYSETEIETLLKKSRLKSIDSFYADGKNTSNYYVIVQKI